MSIATNSNSILKVLSDLSAASDKIIDEKDSDIMFPELLEWMSMVKCRAVKIVESENLAADESLEKIPSLLTYLNGSNQKHPRLSSVLPRVSHLHKKGRKSGVKNKSRRSSLKAQSVRKSSRLLLMETEIELHSTSSNQRGDKTDRSVFLEDKTPSVNGKHANTGTAKRSSKRKSSSELSEVIKKPRLVMNVGGKNAPREGSIQNVKFEKQLMKTKYSSHLVPKYSNTKSSTSMISVLKEENNAKKSTQRIETKQQKAVQNRKNILAVRQQKLEENKRMREEKVEKTRQQRMKLEKEKLGKLKDRCGVNRENFPREKETSSVKEATPKAKGTSIYNLPASPARKPLLNPKKDRVVSLLASKVKATPPPVFKNNTHQREQPVPNKSDAQTKEREIVLNSTYNAEDAASTGKKVKTVPLKNASQAHKKGNEKKADKPSVVTEKHSQPSAEKKGVESYAITPARTSFVSYDISEIRSDSEDEDEGSNSKPIPSWATGVRLRNALLHQHHHPLDTDQLFGNFFESPDLTLIMGVKKKHYKVRTSSAVWNTSSFA